MSDIQAALDSSNAERTLETAKGGLSKQKLERDDYERPYAINLLLHANLFFF